MKKVLPKVLLLVLCLLFGPPLLLRQNKPDRPTVPSPAPVPPPAAEPMVTVYQTATETLQSMTMTDYLVGVLAAEMPASFTLAALKAQAVVARTYTANQMRIRGGPGCTAHPAADVCTAAAHCQGWCAPAQALADWPPEEGAALLKKLRQAVTETAGQVITYQGELIDAVFHSTCGGQTENSEEVWSAALPYLRGVSCPHCCASRWFQTEKEIDAAACRTALAPYLTVLPVTAANRPLLGGAVRSPTGRLKSLLVNGERVSGRDFRAALALPSTNVQWQQAGEGYLFTASGYGHGVGLCQYGAEGMARDGRTYQEIIAYYYCGVEITLLPAP